MRCASWAAGTTWGTGSTGSRGARTSSGGPTGRSRSRPASSSNGRATGARPRATSRSRTTATEWPTATSRYERSHERHLWVGPGPAVGDDVPAVLRLGCLVRHHGHLPDPDAAFHGL